MTKKEVLIKAGSVMMFAVLCIAFFQFFYPYHLFIKEQLQLFLFTSEYFISYLSKPASLASYLGDFFTQFFYLRWGGAIVLALLLCVEWQLIVCLLRKLGAEKNVLLYAFFPIIGEWVLHCGLGYSVSSTITVILCIIIFLLYATIKKRFIAFLVAILLQPILYALLGSGLFTFNLLLLLTDSIRKEKLNLLAYVILFTGILIPLLLRSHYLLTIEQAYIYPHREFMAFVPPLLIIMLAGGMSSREVRIYTSDIRYTPFLFGLQLILLIGGVLSRANFHREKILSLDSEAYFGNWPKVLKQASSYNLNDNIATYYTNLALARYGQLPDHILEFYQPATDGLFLPVNPNASPLTIFFSNEVFFYLGDMNMAQHSSMLGMIFSPNNRSSRLIKRLAEINMINGEKEAARKYLRMLEPTLFHRVWAKKRLQILDADTLIASTDAWLKEKRSMIPKRDTLRSSTDYLASLNLLASSNPANKMAVDYLLCYHLLSKDIRSFTNAYNRYVKDTSSVLPRIYGEALLISLLNSKATDKEVQSYGISPDMIREFAEYTRLYEQSNGRGELLQAKFGKSYWFYFHFAKMDTK